ncbi:ATP-binding protein [Flavobacterium sp. LB2P87]|uniref:ATP-binding protein n=2 Tax=Flavobacterium yafengii TaxID=3041253 RepID=A0AAW6TSY6_9FLAO|nr:ATP-binding protein [Flavobacterium yafengii]MDI5950317.1 ATP-binding protein [Flavobacterium yafengii]
MQGFKVGYFNNSKLFVKLKMDKADGSYLRELAKIERQDVIILNDFGLQTLDSHNRITFLEIIGEKTIADAILDRLIHQSHRISLHGKSMKKKKKHKQGIIF